MKQCIKCGKVMYDEEFFCSRCGLRWSPEYKNADDEETLPLGAAPMGTGLGDDEETLPLGSANLNEGIGDDEETLPLNAYQMRSGIGDDEETLPLGVGKSDTMPYANHSESILANGEKETSKSKISITSIVIVALIIVIGILGGMVVESNNNIRKYQVLITEIYDSVEKINNQVSPRGAYINNLFNHSSTLCKALLYDIDGYNAVITLDFNGASKILTYPSSWGDKDNITCYSSRYKCSVNVSNSLNGERDGFIITPKRTGIDVITMKNNKLKQSTFAVVIVKK